MQIDHVNGYDMRTEPGDTGPVHSLLDGRGKAFYSSSNVMDCLDLTRILDSIDKFLDGESDPAKPGQAIKALVDATVSRRQRTAETQVTAAPAG